MNSGDLALDFWQAQDEKMARNKAHSKKYRELVNQIEIGIEKRLLDRGAPVSNVSSHIYNSYDVAVSIKFGNSYGETRYFNARGKSLEEIIDYFVELEDLNENKILIYHRNRIEQLENEILGHKNAIKSFALPNFEQ